MRTHEIRTVDKDRSVEVGIRVVEADLRLRLRLVAWQ